MGTSSENTACMTRNTELVQSGEYYSVDDYPLRNGLRAAIGE